MERKRVGGIVLAVGVVLLVISALAEPVGLGSGDGFGLTQAAGIIVGAALALVGLALMFVQRGEAETPQPLR